MPLQFVLQELDRELARLEALRKIMGSLSHTPAAVRRALEPVPKPSAKLKMSAPATPDASVPAAKPQPQRKPRNDAGKPRGRRNPKPIQVERALTSTVPSGPVLFNPGHLAQERARQEAGKESDPTTEPQVPSREDLDAESRSLAARWSTGLVH